MTFRCYFKDKQSMYFNKNNQARIKKILIKFKS